MVMRVLGLRVNEGIGVIEVGRKWYHQERRPQKCLVRGREPDSEHGVKKKQMNMG
jgi:hypothetical protein